MAGPFNANPIVVDYQHARHEAVEKRRENVVKEDGASGLFDLFVWTLSTGAFLAAFYVANEAPWQDGDDAAHHAPAVAGRHGLAMARACDLRMSTVATPDARAGARPETGSRR